MIGSSRRREIVVMRQKASPSAMGRGAIHGAIEIDYGLRSMRPALQTIFPPPSISVDDDDFDL